MIAQRTSLLFSRGHTLIELMVAILIGMLLVLAAFQVMATFEGNKRSTTAMNDALQSGNLGLYEIDKLIRSAGTGVNRYGALAGYGCLLNFGTTLNGNPAALPAPFTNTVGGATGVKLRLAPAVIFPGASLVEGGAGTVGSDAVMLMLGGAGYAESPIPITETSGPVLDSTVGFSAGEWVLVGTSAISQCLITKVSAGYTGSTTNVVLPLDAMTLGGASVVANDFAVALGTGPAANFMLFGVSGSGTTDHDTLYSYDFLNGNVAQKVSDDVAIMKAVYGVVDPAIPGATVLTWTPAVDGVVVGANTYNYSPAKLLDGSTGASNALKSIRAIRLAMVVRAPISEKSAANLNSGSVLMFGSLPAAAQNTWTVPSGQPYRYRELETMIPLRNGLL